MATQAQIDALLKNNAANLSLDQRPKLANAWCRFFSNNRSSSSKVQEMLNNIVLKLSNREQVQQQKLIIPPSLVLDGTLQELPSLQAEFSRIIPAPQLQPSKTLLLEQLQNALQTQLKLEPSLAKQISQDKITLFINKIANTIAGTVTVADNLEFYLGQENFNKSELGSWDMLKLFLITDAPMAQIKGSLANIALNEVENRFAATIFKSGLEKFCHERLADKTIVRLFLDVCEHCRQQADTLQHENTEQYNERHIPGIV